MSRAVHLLAGGPGGDARHVVGLLRTALHEGGQPRPRVAYVGAASDDHPGFYAHMAALLKAAGAGEVVLAPTAGAHADGRAARAVLDACDAVFVSGGDVAHGMEVLQAAGLADHLRELHVDGRACIGLSAGSILLGQAWIDWRDPDDDRTAYVHGCLACAPVVCDTHGEDDNWSELRHLLKLMPAPAAGYGISTPAMLRVDPSGALTAVGGEVVRLRLGPHGCRRTRVAAAKPA